MKRRWKVLLGVAGAFVALAAAPILYIEFGCGGTAAGGPAYRPLIRDAEWRREEARTWLTYPEWHIVYSADSFGRFLEKNPPSGYSYLRDIKGFWSGYCAVNKASAESGGADAGTRVMLYTIGLSFSAELLVKGLYENTLGRVSELIGGWDSADDRHAIKVQRAYGAFMHETPWYEFPFSESLQRALEYDGARPQASPLGAALRAQRRIWREGRLRRAHRLGLRSKPRPRREDIAVRHLGLAGNGRATSMPA